MLKLRKFTTSIQETMLKENWEARQNAIKTTKLWKNINLFLVIPALIAVGFYTIPEELKHIKHMEEHPRKFVPLSYMRKHKNDFPWGKESLFHNPKANPVPDE